MSHAKNKTKIILYILLFFIILCAAGWGLYKGLYKAFSDFMIPEKLKQIDHIRAKVLYHTNHEELLRVCREKLAAYNKSISDDKRSKEGISASNQINSDDSQKEFDSTDKSCPLRMEDFPRKTYMRILDLNPTFVYISREWIDLEMCTAFYRVSIMAFPEGIEGYGDLKLIDGLWYNDDGFEYPDFSDHLEKLKNKNLNNLDHTPPQSLDKN